MIPSDIKDLPFTPSVYCVGKEHRRFEVCRDLINNPEFRSVGTCKKCRGKKYYAHENLLSFILNDAIQPQSKIRRY